MRYFNVNVQLTFFHHFQQIATYPQMTVSVVTEDRLYVNRKETLLDLNEKIANGEIDMPELFPQPYREKVAMLPGSVVITRIDELTKEDYNEWIKE